MSGHTFSVRLQILTQKVGDELEEIIHSVKGFHLLPKDSKSCDLLIMEMGNDLERDFELIKEIQDSKRTREIFLTSRNTNPEILIKALRTGIKEFFPQPIQKEEVKDALLRFIEQKESHESTKGPVKKAKIIDVMGGKGGVGTTTVAVNLATSLIKLEDVESVALIDLNHNFGEVPVFLGIKTNFNWTNIVKDVSRLDTTYLESVLFRHSSGVQVLSSSGKLTEDYPATPQAINMILKLMHTMFDFIVIDSGQFLDGIHREVLKLSDTLLLVAGLSLPCLINVKKKMDIFHNIGYPPEKNIHIIVNGYQKNSFITIKEAEESINKKFLFEIPDDYQLTMSAINQGKPLNVLDRKAKISQSFKELSAIIAGKGPKKKKRFLGLKLLTLLLKLVIVR
ncbi:MAG: AAA family ATPase [bacterium]